jgi:predicted small lipoprotein YifL
MMISSVKIISSRAAFLLVICLLLQACGTKGPLYLPKPDDKPAQSEQQRK